MHEKYIAANPKFKVFDPGLKKESSAHFDTSRSANLDIEKDQEYHEFSDSYNKDFFWEYLEDELAKRDLLEKHEKKAIAGMDTKKWFDLLGKEFEKYYQEFAKNGVKNMRIVK